jgi:hypothetical protein
MILLSNHCAIQTTLLSQSGLHVRQGGRTQCGYRLFHGLCGLLFRLVAPEVAFAAATLFS